MTYSKLKSMLVPYVNEDRSGIRFGGFQKNIARDIPTNQPELLLNVTQQFNGQRSNREISKIINVPETIVNQIEEILIQASILTQNTLSDTSISIEESKYFSRNLNFFAWVDVTGKYLNYWKAQEKLKSARVLILGAGGTGSNVGVSLARLGIGNITIVDQDIIVINNFNRQVYTSNQLGQNKSTTLAHYLEEINPFSKVNGIVSKINSYSDIEKLGSDYDIVINAMDSPRELPNWLDSYAEKYNIKWVLGGYASTIITIGIFDGKVDGLIKKFEKNKVSDYNQRQVDNALYTWENAVISPIAAISGYFSALYTMYELTHIKEIPPGVVRHIDLFNVDDSEVFSYELGGMS